MKGCCKDLRECSDARLERRQYKNAAGVVLHCLQCMTCGRHTSYKVKRDESDPPELDRELEQRGQEAQRKQWEDDAAAKRWEAEEAAALRRAQYAAYLATPEWAAIRALVVKRDVVCQGCLSAPIENVHHLTYDHVGAEFAFELVGLCRKCHARVHGVAESEAVAHEDF
ncbi:MAG TPA: hypothetical protein P5205_19675 [Candidatus Paceibacterota bacterium]|nr:hypothetical protein [Verrucomicrobiota bacterium]HSA12586.1 hypothetical protein [Candidatus Paceibacterota bacterium]